ncbi:MAG: T9SS type A sorting domain-containing protein, partial [Flavobacteriales bacterium]|nr:T9SS type A sorting domain-containing protein [Flavobacteriales bacterium]
DGTAIDGCSGATEGGCPLPPNPAPGEATIMSYCQDELADGFVADAPFGPQPGAVIRASVAAASCLEDCATEEVIYLPDVLGSGPALLQCDDEPAPAGYTLAASQFCALGVLDSDPACSDISWDGICQSSYEACWEPGCMDPTACNYDPESNIDDGSCEYPGCVDCALYDFAPVDLTKSFDPVDGIQDRVQVKWFKDVPQVRYSDEDAAMCDIKFWPKRDLDPVTGDPIGPAYVAPDTTFINDRTKTYGDGSPRQIFKWPIKFRADGANNSKRADPNIRYEWQVRCECGHSGTGPESPWSEIKIFNVPDFDPTTGIYTPPPGQGPYTDDFKSSLEVDIQLSLYPNPNDGRQFILESERLFENAERLTMEIIDITGKLIHSESLASAQKGTQVRIEMGEDLENGLYLVHVYTDDQRFMLKMLVE